MRKICLFNRFCEIKLIQRNVLFTEAEFPTTSAFHFFFFNDDNIKDGHVQHACIWMHGCLTLYFQNEFNKYPQYFSL